MKGKLLRIWSLKWEELLSSSAVAVDRRVQHLAALLSSVAKLIMYCVHSRLKGADGIVYVNHA